MLLLLTVGYYRIQRFDGIRWYNFRTNYRKHRLVHNPAVAHYCVQKVIQIFYKRLLKLLKL
jgi:hypothetical protein